MCHIVLFNVYRHRGSMDSRRKKLQHQIKIVFYPQLPDRFVFLHRIMKEDCYVDFYTSNTMQKRTLLYSRNNSANSVQIKTKKTSVDPANQTRYLDMQVELYKNGSNINTFLFDKLNSILGEMSVQQHLCELRLKTSICSKPDEYTSSYCWKIIRQSKIKASHQVEKKQKVTQR